MILIQKKNTEDITVEQIYESASIVADSYIELEQCIYENDISLLESMYRYDIYEEKNNSNILTESGTNYESLLEVSFKDILSKFKRAAEIVIEKIKKLFRMAAETIRKICKYIRNFFTKNKKQIEDADKNDEKSTDTVTDTDKLDDTKALGTSPDSKALGTSDVKALGTSDNRIERTGTKALPKNVAIRTFEYTLHKCDDIADHIREFVAKSSSNTDQFKKYCEDFASGVYTTEDNMKKPRNDRKDFVGDVSELYGWLTKSGNDGTRLMNLYNKILKNPKTMDYIDRNHGFNKNLYAAFRNNVRDEDAKIESTSLSKSFVRQTMNDTTYDTIFERNRASIEKSIDTEKANLNKVMDYGNKALSSGNGDEHVRRGVTNGFAKACKVVNWNINVLSSISSAYIHEFTSALKSMTNEYGQILVKGIYGR